MKECNLDNLIYLKSCSLLELVVSNQFLPLILRCPLSCFGRNMAGEEGNKSMKSENRFLAHHSSKAARQNMEEISKGGKSTVFGMKAD